MTIFLLSLIMLLLPSSASPQPTFHGCQPTCGNYTVPYPFGFSSACGIPLNCSENGQKLLQDFSVQAILDNTIKLNLEPKCNRSLDSLHRLFTDNYAPTALNALLLHNCTVTPPTSCSIPAINVESSFQSSAGTCANNTVSCFNQIPPSTGPFLNYSLAEETTQCKLLLSSILASASNSSGVTSLEVQVMELEWWLRGECGCSPDADCFNVLTHDGGKGFRCRCRHGYVGNGYPEGGGCRKAITGCTGAKFVTGDCGGGTRIGVLVGAVVAGAVLMVSLGLLCCLIRRHSAAKAKSFKSRCLAEAKGINIPIYSYKEIEKSTNGFSDKHRLGTGAYGTVYAGKLHSDLWVAIKKIRHGDTDSIEQVMNEIKLISSVSHPNLVRLLGCCIENGEQILVYEFMPNGTLCQHLQRERGDGLPWPVRLVIATETARAIAHLHSAIDPPIFHRDIKSSNILLDHNFRSKVADFGLSRLGRTEISHISTVPQGTPGYLDPQYHQHFHLSDKSDVYSFGVVLVEIITGLKAVDFSRPANEINLAALATERIVSGRLEEIIDPLIETHADAWTLCSVFKVAELAFRCLAFQRDMRPAMTEVAAELEQIMHCRWTPSEETNYTESSEISACCSSSSDASEKPLSSRVKKTELGRRAIHVENSMELARLNSPVSVQDPWLSEQSSPSSSSLLNNQSR